MTVMRSKIWKRALVVLAAIGLLTTLGVTPAFASDAGKNCRTYYFHNDPSSGWGFTVCVKLTHDPTLHTWQANGSVTTTTSGMTLHTATTTFDMNNTVYVFRSKGPAATQILGIATDPWPCSGVNDFAGWVDEYVTWPNGANSSPTTTATLGSDGIEGDFYTGSC